MTGYLLAVLAAAVAILPTLYRRWRDGRTIARLRADVAVETGRADTAEAQAHVEAQAGERSAAAVEVAAEYREAVAAEAGPSPLDRIRAADRVRAKIARRKP